MLEICAPFDTLIADADGVYDPAYGSRRSGDRRDRRRSFCGKHGAEPWSSSSPPRSRLHADRRRDCGGSASRGAFLVQPHPPPFALAETILDLHRDGGAQVRQGIGHHRDQRPIAMETLDLEPCGLCRTEAPVWRGCRRSALNSLDKGHWTRPLRGNAPLPIAMMRVGRRRPRGSFLF